MVGRGNHVVRRLTILAGLVLVLGTLTWGLPALPATADERQCVEYDENGRCIRWDSGGGVFVEDDVTHFPVPYEQPPDDTFVVYGITSPCDGGGPPGISKGYQCDEWMSCPDPEKQRRFEVWSQLRKHDQSRDYWEVHGDFRYEGTWCLAKHEGGDQDLIERTGLGNAWVSYVTLLPPGEPEIEPGSGATLVNLETNFYTENTEPIRYYLDLTVSGRLDVRATPIAYSWDFGEGEEPLVTDRAGRPYDESGDDFDVSYQYQETGRHQIQLQTEYQMAHRPAGQDWSEDAVYTSAPAEATNIRVLEASQRHVMGDDVYE